MAQQRVPLDAGERDYAVQVEQRVVSQPTGGSGMPVETWVPLHDSYYCRRMDVSGRERFAAGQLAAPYTTRWDGPYTADMDPDVVDVPADRRLVYRGRVLDIVAASLIGRRDGVELLTKANAGG